MRPITFSKNSWHYRLANFFTSGDVLRHTTDLCSYVKLVGVSMFLALLITLLVAFVTACTADALAWIAAMITAGSLFQGDPPALVAIAGWIIVGAMVLWIKWCEYRFDHPKPEPSTPSFVAVAYSSIKDKLCFRVEFVAPEADK